MPHFEVQLTKKLQRVFDLQQDAVIGRAPQCEIQLLSRAVSRRHARVEFGDQGEAIISDLGTKNGIKLNGERVMGAAVIQDGDQILVGDVTMSYRGGSMGAPVSANAIDLRSRAVTHEDVIAAQQADATFVLPSEAAAIGQFVSLVGKARIESLDFDDVTQLKLQVALKESLENARQHGSGGDPSLAITVSFSDSSEEFRFSVRDEGPGFNVHDFLANASELDALVAVRERPNLGPGLGLRMILDCVDRIQFEGGGATIHLAKFKAGEEVFVIQDGEETGELIPVSPLEETEDVVAEPPTHESWVGEAQVVDNGGDKWWEESDDHLGAPFEAEGKPLERDEIDLHDSGDGFEVRLEGE